MNQPPFRIVRPEADDIATDDELQAGLTYADREAMPTDQEVLDTLVVNNGIIPRAAAKLGVPEAYVVSIVSKSPRTLSTKLRAVMMLHTFSTLIKLDAAMQANVHELPPDALGRTYGATIAAFSNLAGQFEEKEETDNNDDAGEAKQFMLDKLDKLGARAELEAAQRATEHEQEAAS